MKINVLYGSETGNAEDLSEQTSERLKKEGFESEHTSMDDYSVDMLSQFDGMLIIITSTWGDGEPPSNAMDFHGAMATKPNINLEKLRFAVLGLGDTSYPEFCKCAQDFDEWLEELGAKRILTRVDCDIDYEEPYETWLNNLVDAIKKQVVAA
ncbi:MAG: flavodoxin domain-containing protein [Cyanobacteria bacterium P01_H01_bin.74]